MNAAEVLEIGQDLIWTSLLLALPALLISLVVGLVISILQTITSIQDQTLTFVPRLVAVGLAFVFTMTWSLNLAIHFTVRMLARAAEVTQ
jgi:flagellar biosynthetic protein FliQ